MSEHPSPTAQPDDSETPDPLAVEAPAWRRLHPMSWLFQIAGSLRGLIGAIIALGIAGRGARFLLPVVVLFAALGPVVRFLTFQYRLEDEELVVRSGLLMRRERRVPYSRIQNIDLVRNPLHRLFGVAVARLETASGGRPEAVLDALSSEAIAELRRHALESKDTALPDAGAQEHDLDSTAKDRSYGSPLLELGVPELVRLGLISNRGMVAVAAVLAIVLERVDLIDVWDLEEKAADVEQVGGQLGDLPSLLGERMLLGESLALTVLAGVGALLLLALIALVLLYALSISLAIVRFYGFRLERRGDDLRTEFGLLTRVAVNTARHRIQRLQSRETLLHRLFKRLTVRIDTAGGTGGDGEGNDSPSRARQWLAPILDHSRRADLVRAAMPEVDPDPANWNPIAFRAWKRKARQFAILPLLMAAVLAFWSPWWLFLLLALPAVMWMARQWIRHRNWCLTENSLQFREGWWTREWTIVRLSKIQSVHTAQSPFDRRHRMARVRIDTAGTRSLGFAIEIPYLELEDAQVLAQRLYREAAGREFAWA